MGLPRCSWPAGPQRPRALKVIKFGSDFTGLDAAAAALNRMQVPHHCVFSSDLLTASQKILQHVYQPKQMFKNILDRIADQEEPVDIYVTTPPCQDFSSAGKQTGKDGPRQTGALITKSMQYVRAHKPRIVIFENVLAMLRKKFNPIVAGILKALKGLGYQVHHNALDSRDYGLPQDRRRLIIVAIQANVIKHEFKWPARQAAPGVATFLDPWKPTDKAGSLPYATRPPEGCVPEGLQGVLQARSRSAVHSDPGRRSRLGQVHVLRRQRGQDHHSDSRRQWRPMDLDEGPPRYAS